MDPPRSAIGPHHESDHYRPAVCPGVRPRRVGAAPFGQGSVAPAFQPGGFELLDSAGPARPRFGKHGGSVLAASHWRRKLESNWEKQAAASLLLGETMAYREHANVTATDSLKARLDINSKYGAFNFHQWAISHMQISPGMDLLDVGCGTGVQALLALDLVGGTGSVSAF